MTRCLIIDDEPPAREGMRKLLLAHEEVEIIGEASNVDVAVRLCEQHCPDIVFLDIQLRGESGFDFITAAPDPLPHIIFVTAHDRYATEAFRVDAVDYLLKPVQPEHLSEALRRAATRLAAAAPPASDPSALRALGLTTREAEVLFWLAQGKSNPEIAAILHNSPGTVKKQVQRIFDHLRVDSRVSAALVASRILGLR